MPISAIFTPVCNTCNSGYILPRITPPVPKRIRFLPDGVKLFRNNVCERTRDEMIMGRKYKIFATLPERDVSVIDVNVTKDVLPSSMEDVDRYNLVRNYVVADNIQIKELQCAINAAVRIPGKHQEDGGSGIIVNHKGRKYLITALHISSVKDLVLGYGDKIRAYNNGKEFTISKNQLIYPRFCNNRVVPQKNIPLADIAVFEYDGECEGVTPAINNNENSIEPLFAIGYPAGEQKYYFRDHQSPLVSFGFGTQEKSVVQNISHIQNLFKVDANHPQGRKWFYTGASLPGNSGSGVVDLNGNLKAILCGRMGGNSDMNDYTFLFSPEDIFRALEFRYLEPKHIKQNLMLRPFRVYNTSDAGNSY